MWCAYAVYRVKKPFYSRFLAADRLLYPALLRSSCASHYYCMTVAALCLVFLSCWLARQSSFNFASRRALAAVIIEAVGRAESWIIYNGSGPMKKKRVN